MSQAGEMGNGNGVLGHPGHPGIVKTSSATWEQSLQDIIWTPWVDSDSWHTGTSFPSWIGLFFSSSCLSFMFCLCTCSVHTRLPEIQVKYIICDYSSNDNENVGRYVSSCFTYRSSMFCLIMLLFCNIESYNQLYLHNTNLIISFNHKYLKNSL